MRRLLPTQQHHRVTARPQRLTATEGDGTAEHRRHLLVNPMDLLIVEGAAVPLVDRLLKLADVSVHVGMPDSEQPTNGNEPVDAAKARPNFVITPWTAR